MFATYRKVLAIAPKDGIILTNLGAALSDRGFHSPAVDVLRRAVVHIPEDRNAHFNLAVALMNTNSDGRSEAPAHFATAAKLECGTETREAYFDPHGY